MSALAARPGSATMPAGRPTEFAFSADDHRRIADFVYGEAGILMPPGKAQLVYGRLAPRVRACRLTSFADYIARIDRDAEERQRAIDALTTNHTSFFREAHHFDHFLEHAWPALDGRLADRGRVRIWSAACSSGEEPYTLLMAMCGTQRGVGQRLARSDFRLLATDLSTEILAAAAAGRYAPDTAKTVPEPLRRTWMRDVDHQVEVDPLLRELCAFRKLNLLEDWPMRGTFDAIFCRNVMIYFDEPTKERLQTRLADRLAPGGFLYIGHSERLSPSVAPRFTCVGRTTFQKVAA
ncbi:protein-glutamate O-methyltransferase CheR [Sphingomonas sp. MA1305]|uniref:CheR family methyltransferase n=1 Tax=Sphingomonas sp. MA1305 TaxID=2479204 RepID=UPI0018DEFBEE|nr:protein-glutamate O-methyltransferase [Sphingomonas sp. MA1305]MBI0475347.1 protein-glutamate O-methyltransferase CheR [Sphingomonas sp. MA1305]